MKSTNSEQPLVSVIMPTYNHAKFIGKAIDSVLNQTYKDLELIIVDNYSEDDTEEIVASYKDDRIIYLKFRNNGIIAASRNHGIKHSHGEYIAFLDSDDLWMSEKLEKQVPWFDDSEVGLVYSKCFVLKNNEVYRTAPNMKLYNGYAFHKMIFITNVPVLTAVIRKEVVEKIGLFDEDMKLIGLEDNNYWIRLSKVFKVMSVNKPVAIYREHLNNLSKKSAYQFAQSYLYLSKKLLRLKIITFGQWIFFSLPGWLVLSLHKTIGSWLSKHRISG